MWGSPPTSDFFIFLFFYFLFLFSERCYVHTSEDIKSNNVNLQIKFGYKLFWIVLSVFD